MTWKSRYFGIHTILENQELYSSKDWRLDNLLELTIYLRGTHMNIIVNLLPHMTGKGNLR